MPEDSFSDSPPFGAGCVEVGGSSATAVTAEELKLLEFYSHGLSLKVVGPS